MSEIERDLTHGEVVALSERLELEEQVARPGPDDLSMVEIIEPDGIVNVVVSEDGRRLWVCTENGTVLRAKVARITVDDRRIR